MRSLLVVCILGIATRAGADSDTKRRAVVEAIAKGDVAAVEAAAKLPLQIRGLWFDRKECQPFTGKRELAAAELPALVACLQGIELVPHGPAIYGPGVALWVMFDADGRVKALVGLRPGKFDADQAVIEPTVFQKHVAGFQREVVPEPATKQKLDADSRTVSVMATVCVDKRGKLERVELSHTDDAATYAATVDKVVRAWKIKPVVSNGKPIRACSMLRLGYPDSGLSFLAFPPPPPPPPPPGQSPDVTAPPPTGAPGAPQNVAPTLLETHRISGNKQIVPNDLTKVAIAQKKVERLIGSWKLCVSDRGEVKSIKKLKATGFPDYDAKIEREMGLWKYRPYLINGKPVNVCTAVTFIYTQQAPAKRR